MSQSLCMHVDGSRVLSDDRSRQGTGWAVVAVHADEHIEESGAISQGRHSVLGGYHEHVAFVQGVLLASRLGVPFERVTIVCDDDVFGYAATALHPENYLGTRRDKLLERLQHTVRNCFDASAFDLTMRAFEKARILKVKGHQRHVYQERADYLARMQARAAAGVAQEPLVGFDEWLQCGLEHYVHHDEPPVRWYAPFVEVPAQVQ